MIFAGSGEHLAARGAEEPDSSGALQQAAGPGGVATGDGGPTDWLSRGSPHPPGPTDRPVGATTGTPAKGQRSQKGLCQTVLPNGAENTVTFNNLYCTPQRGRVTMGLLSIIHTRLPKGARITRGLTVLPKRARVILGSP